MAAEGLLRDKRILQNISWSAVMRLASLGINLILVPLLISYLGKSNYGVWLTISSFVGWGAVLDLGIGNGLKNKLATLWKEEPQSAQQLVSTAYGLMIGIAILFLVVIVPVIYLVEWSALFGTQTIDESQLKIVMAVFFSCFAARLILSLLLNVAAAMQRTSLADVISVLINLSCLIGVLLLMNIPFSGLVPIALLFGLVPILVLSYAGYWLYSNKYKTWAPSIKSFDCSLAKELLGLGGGFFVIQLAGIIIFSTDNLIISHYIDPATVTEYHVAFRYFGLAIMFFSLICTPLWPAFTEAYCRKDIDWVKLTMRRLMRVWMLTALVLVVMVVVSSRVYAIWIGDGAMVRSSLTLLMGFYALTLTWGMMFVTFVNSVGAIRLQTYFSIVAGIVNIPLSLFLLEYTNLGPGAVILATMICLSYGPLVAVFQYRKIILGTAKGIWSK